MGRLCPNHPGQMPRGWSIVHRSLAACAVLVAALLIAAPAPSLGQPIGQGAGADIIGAVLSEAQIGSPAQVGSLVIYPIVLPPRFSPSLGLVPVFEALKSGDFRISEMSNGMDQFHLAGFNSGGSNVFGQGGGFYQGGRQGRGGGGGGFLMAPMSRGGFGVFCFEEGRTEGTSSLFSADGYSLAHPTLRGLVCGDDQNAVWREITRERRVLGVTDPAATSYGHVVKTEGVRAQLKVIDSSSQSLPSHVNGVVVAIGDRILGIDLYGDKELFGKTRALLLGSYAIANAEVGSDVRCTVGEDGVWRFLGDVASCGPEQVRSVDLGDTFRLGFGSHRGEALVWNGQLVHLGVYDTRPLAR